MSLEISIFIHGNRFLTNKIKIILLSRKKSHSVRRDLDPYLLSQFQCCRVFINESIII